MSSRQANRPVYLKLFFAAGLVLFIFLQPGAAQMRQVYLDTVSTNNDIQKISFYTPSEGFIASTSNTGPWVGYTTDSGKTFLKRPITNSNVDYNGYSVNLTFGFGLAGVKAFNQNTLIAYGDYGFVTAILYSTNGGISFKLVYQSQFDPLLTNLSGVSDMVFPENNAIGYAIDVDRVLKTTDQGLTWNVVRTDPASFFNHLEGVDNNNVFVMNTRNSSAGKVLKTSNGGSSWQTMTFPAIPQSSVTYLQFLTANTGWVAIYASGTSGYFYKTTNGGASWTLLNNIDANPFFSTKFKFTDINTGYSLGAEQNTLYKTTNGGTTWEPLPRNNNFSYLGYTHTELQCISGTQLWAGGGRDFLELSTNGGGTPIPQAYFNIDTAGLTSTGLVNLYNYSKTGYTFKWLLNNTPISTLYNAAYTHNPARLKDSIGLVVSNGVTSDTTFKYQYFYPPVTVTSFTPTAAGNGAVVTISGTRFTGVTGVSFGGVAAASFTVQSATSIAATVGAGASGYVKVVTNTGKDSLAGFTYISAPAISSFAPAAATAGTVVTISGNNFTTTTAVSFAGIPATSFTVLSDSTIRAVAPSGGSGAITVTTTGGSNALAGFIALSAIASFSPANGTEGSILTVTGTSFTGVTAVSAGGVPVLSFTVNSATNITAVIGAGASGDILVAKTGGSASLPGFAWSAAPVISSFSPNAGPVGTAVTITGSGFDANPASNIVYFGAVRATVNASSSNALSVTVPVGASFQPFSLVNTTNGLMAYSAKPFLVTFAGGSIAAHTFGMATNIDIGATNTSAGATAVSDLDGDGKTDLIVPVYSSTNNSGLLLLRSNSTPGNVSFAAPVLLKSIYFNAFALGDLNGDGRPDLAAVYDSGNVFIKIFLNTSVPGSISFQPAMVLPASARPGNLCLGDVDGDGKTDIASSSGMVYRNIGNPGTPGFAAGVSVNANGAYNVLLTDIDNDNKPDLVFPNAGSGSSYTMKNNCSKGTINFAAPVYFQAFSQVYTSVADMDDDGLTDLVAADYNGAIAVIKNTSTTGSISFDAPVKIIADTIPAGAVISDLDGDGKPDIATSLSNYDLAVFKNNSTPGSVSIAPQMYYLPRQLPYGWNQPALGDIDGDGRNDAVTNSSAAHTITIRLNTVTNLPFVQSFLPKSGAVGDTITITGSNFAGVSSVVFGGIPASSFVVNSPTSISAVLSRGASGQVSVETAAGTGSLAGFNFLPSIASFIPANGLAGTLVTIKGNSFTGTTAVNFGSAGAASFTILSDSMITAVIGLGNTGSLSVINAAGTAVSKNLFTYITAPAPVITSFTPLSGKIGSSVTITGKNFSSNAQANKVFFGSIKAQVTAGNTTSLTVTVPGGAAYEPIVVNTSFLTAISERSFFTTFAGPGVFTRSSFANRADTATGHTNGNEHVYFKDLNGDGKLDVIASGGGGIAVFKNTSTNNGLITLDTIQYFSDLFAGGKPAFADFDGDGKIDLAMPDFWVKFTNNNALVINRNISTDSTIMFEPFVAFEAGTNPMSAAVGDLDGDGKTDVVLGNYYSRTVSVFRNTTQGAKINFDTKIDIAIFDALYDLKIADIDGDKKPDLIVLNTDVNAHTSVSVYRNLSSPGAISFGPRVDVKAGGSPYTLVTGDIDGDLKTDLVTANSVVGIAVVRNTSTPGNISFAPELDIPVNGSFSWGVGINDMNGDGKPDLIASEYWFIDSVAVIQNYSTPGHLAFAHTINYATGNFPIGVATGDLDGDGKPDIATLNHEDSYPLPTTVSLLRNLSSDKNLQLCAGNNASLSAGANGLIYQWQQNTGTGFSNITDNSVVSGSNSATLQLSNIPSAYNNYQYRCITDGVAGSSALLSISNTPITPAVTISASDSSICPGTALTFTATQVNGGDFPSWQWLVNNTSTGVNLPVLTDSSLTSNSQVKLIMTSSALCTTASIASDTILIKINSVIPAVSITGTTTLLQGAAALITATALNGGSTPAYQWQDSTHAHAWQNINGATDSSISYKPVQTGDKIRNLLTGNAICATTATATSNTLLFTVNTITAINPVPAITYGIKYHPNPVTTTLYIDSLKPGDQWQSLDIITASGKNNVLSMRISNQITVSIDVQPLANGFYIALLRRKKGAPVYLKFIKL